MVTAEPHYVRRSNEPEDAGLALWRDHTFLQMLAEGFHFVARVLRSHDPVDGRRIEEGVAIHRAFLVDLHARRLAVMGAALSSLPGAPYRNGLAECTRERDRAATAAAELADGTTSLGAGGGAVARTQLADLLDHEADRWTVHFHREEEDLFPRLDRTLGADGLRALSAELGRLWSESGPVEERLTSWTSRLGPSSD